MTVKEFLEHCDPQQKVIVYSGRSYEESGKVKDLVKKCSYLDNEVSEFFMCAMSHGYIGVYSGPSTSFKYENVTSDNLSDIMTGMIEFLKSNHVCTVSATATMTADSDKYNVAMRVTKENK